MPDTLEVLCRSVVKNDSIVHFQITSFANRPVNRLLHEGPILGVNPFQEHGIRRLGALGIEAKDAKMLSRPEELPGGNIPTPTTCVAYSLAFRQVGFTAAQLLFRAPALRELFSESILYTLAFPDIGQHPIHSARRLVSAQKFVRWHIVQISADRAAVDDHGMRADDVEDEFRWKKASIV